MLKANGLCLQSFSQQALFKSSPLSALKSALPNHSEVGYGILGGLTNGAGTFFMIWSTEVSTPLEHATIFPIFSPYRLSSLATSEGGSQWLYKERVNWLANGLCVLCILV